MIAPVALPVTIVEHSLRIKIVNHHQVKVPTWMTLESGMILLEYGMMVIGRYCAAFTDMGRVTYIFFLFYPSKIPTMAASKAAMTAAAKDEESRVGGRINRKKNNSVSDSGGVYVSFFFFVLVFLSLSHLPCAFNGVSRG